MLHSHVCIGQPHFWASRTNALLLQGAKEGVCDEEQGWIKSHVFGMALTKTNICSCQ